MDASEIAKQYLAKNNPLMEDGKIVVADHDTSLDLHVVQHLDGVDESHVDQNPYQVVTVIKKFPVEGAGEIEKIVKLQIKNNEVERVVESK